MLLFWDRVVKYSALVILTGESIFVALFITLLIVMSAVNEPIPMSPIPGLPEILFDSLAEFRLAETWFIPHFLLFFFLVPYEAGAGDKISAWYFPVAFFTVGTDVAASISNWRHLSRAHPTYRTLILVQCVIALVLSGAQLFWFSFYYGRYRLTGHRFDKDQVSITEGELQGKKPVIQEQRGPSSDVSVVYVKKTE